MSEPVLRQATPDDTEGISRLLSVVFPQNPRSDAKVLDWQYWQNPIMPPFSWVFEDRDKIVCHYAAIPVWMLVAGKRTIGVIAIDAATHPEYQGRGLFSRLTLEALEAASARKTLVTLGFQHPSVTVPSPVSMSRNALDLYLRLAVPKRRKRSCAHQRSPEGLDQLWGRVSHSYPYGIVRDETWWAWRYGSHPRAPYSFFSCIRDGVLAGCAVAKQHPRRRIVQLLDLLAVDASAARQLLRSIEESFPECRAIAFRASSANHATNLLRAAGFRRVPSMFDRHSPRFVVVPHNDELRALEQAPWVLSWGDMDTV